MRSRALPLLLAAVAALTASVPVSADDWSGPPPPHRTRRPTPPAWEDPAPAPAFTLDVVDAGGVGLPLFFHRGQRWVMGSLGQRYRVRVRNPTPWRVEAVVSVDGLDAVDGRTASLDKRGYVLPPYGEITIEGFRTSLDSVAAFRFSSVRDSYAGRKGQDRNVGVIGVAFFRERAPVAVARPPRPRPWWRGGDDSDRAAPSAGAASPGRSSSAAPAPAAEAPRKQREGLGTAFGEQRESRVSETSFVRESSWPTARLEVRYDDREGLRAMGIRVDPDPIAWEDEGRLRRTADPFPASRRFATPPP